MVFISEYCAEFGVLPLMILQLGLLLTSIRLCVCVHLLPKLPLYSYNVHRELKRLDQSQKLIAGHVTCRVWL